MNIVIAPDSFKGSLTSNQAAQIMKAAIIDVHPDVTVQLKPMADGGEGTIESLLTSIDGQVIPVQCAGPLRDQIDTTYAAVDTHTAIIEYAKIAGLTQVPIKDRNPDITTSYGLGEVILHAIDHGYETIVIGLGGSATIDGGLGMLLALGMKAYDEEGNQVGPFGKNLHKVKNVCLADIDPRLEHVNIKVACDVDNPLCGKWGASEIYGPQKGATKKQVASYEEALNNFADIIEEKVGQSYKKTFGAGAAGGIGFSLRALGAELVSGAALLAQAMHTEEAIKEADLVITGEGESNLQTLYGKAPSYIAKLGKKYHIPVILISGSLEGDLEPLREEFAGCFSIINKPMPLEKSMAEAESLLYAQTKQIMHLIASLMELNVLKVNHPRNNISYS